MVLLSAGTPQSSAPPRYSPNSPAMGHEDGVQTLSSRYRSRGNAKGEAKVRQALASPGNVPPWDAMSHAVEDPEEDVERGAVGLRPRYLHYIVKVPMARDRHIQTPRHPQSAIMYADGFVRAWQDNSFPAADCVDCRRVIPRKTVNTSAAVVADPGKAGSRSNPESARSGSSTSQPRGSQPQPRRQQQPTSNLDLSSSRQPSLPQRSHPQPDVPEALCPQSDLLEGLHRLRLAGFGRGIRARSQAGWAEESANPVQESTTPKPDEPATPAPPPGPAFSASDPAPLWSVEGWTESDGSMAPMTAYRPVAPSPRFQDSDRQLVAGYPARCNRRHAQQPANQPGPAGAGRQGAGRTAGGSRGNGDRERKDAGGYLRQTSKPAKPSPFPRSPHAPSKPLTGFEEWRARMHSKYQGDLPNLCALAGYDQDHHLDFTACGAIPNLLSHDLNDLLWCTLSYHEHKMVAYTADPRMTNWCQASPLRPLCTTWLRDGGLACSSCDTQGTGPVHSEDQLCAMNSMAYSLSSVHARGIAADALELLKEYVPSYLEEQATRAHRGQLVASSPSTLAVPAVSAREAAEDEEKKWGDARGS